MARHPARCLGAQAVRVRGGRARIDAAVCGLDARRPRSRSVQRRRRGHITGSTIRGSCTVRRGSGERAFSDAVRDCRRTSERDRRRGGCAVDRGRNPARAETLRRVAARMARPCARDTAHESSGQGVGRTSAERARYLAPDRAARVARSRGACRSWMAASGVDSSSRHRSSTVARHGRAAARPRVRSYQAPRLRRQPATGDRRSPAVLQSGCRVDLETDPRGARVPAATISPCPRAAIRSAT